MATEVFTSFVTMSQPVCFALLHSALFNKEGVSTGSDSQ